MCFVELKTLTKFVAAQVCRPHMLFLCLHAVCSPSNSFGTSMEKCFMSREKLFVKILLEKGVKHCYCVRKSQREATLFRHPCRGIPLINVEKWILTFFSRRCSLSFYQWVRLIKPCCEKIYYLHINGTKVQNNYYKSIHTVLSALHMIAMARSFNPC